MARIAWGAKVSDTFLDRAAWIVEDLAIGDNGEDGLNKLMSCIAWESGRTFSPKVTNKAGSGATGLIQFMPTTAKTLGTTTTALAKMSAEDQLNYVWKYFSSHKGKLKTLADLYMAILWPKGVGKPESYVLWDQDTKPTTFRQNAGLDVNKDGAIIKAEAAAKVTAMLTEGLSPDNSREYALNIRRESDTIVVEGDEPDEAVSPVVVTPVPVVPIPTPITESVAPTVSEVKTDAAIVTTVVQPNTTLTKISRAAAGRIGNWTGLLAIASTLLLDPQFASLVGKFTTALASDQGGTRLPAIIAFLGGCLLIYRDKS